MKSANAYQRNGKLYISTLSKTTTGILIGSGPVFAVDPDDLLKVGEIVISALDASKEQIPHPDQSAWKEILKPLLQLAGVKSWNTFSKGTKCVGIELKEDQVFFIPTKNMGVKNGFGDINEKKFFSLLSVEDVGKSLITAFDISEK